MAIKIQSIQCSNCGADLKYEEGRQMIFCSYCGKQVVLTNDNEYVYRMVDEARMKEAETERLVRLKQLALEENESNEFSSVQKTILSLWIPLSIIIIIICIFKWAIQGDFVNGTLMLFYLGGPVIGGGAYLIFKYIPEKRYEKIIAQRGGIRIPKSCEPFSEQNYEVLKAAFSAAGFLNVTCVNLHDISLGLFQKPGKVERVTVNGQEIVSGGKMFLPDDNIVITYHGK